VRYHSFYPWHSEGSYEKLTNKKDKQYKDWIKDFNQYDLYSKSNHMYQLEELKDY
jgi:inositol oxygenase